MHDESVFIIRTAYLPGTTELSISKYVPTDDFLEKYKPSSEIVEFDDGTIDSRIKDRINSWIDDMISVVSFDPSSIVTRRFLSLVKNTQEKNLMVNFLTAVLTYFLYSINITIEKSKAFLYCEFILSEAVKKIKTLNLEELD